MNADLLQWFINFLIERNSGGTFKNEVISNKELGEELPKPIIRKFKKKKVHSPFMGSMQGTDLVGMQLTSKFNKGFRFLLCVIDIYSKYTWVILLEDKKVLQLLMLFKNFQMNQTTNEIKYGQIRAVNFAIDQ